MGKRLEHINMKTAGTEELDKKFRSLDDRLNAMSKNICNTDDFVRKMKEMHMRLSSPPPPQTNAAELMALQKRLEKIERKQTTAPPPAWTPMHIVVGGWTDSDGRENIESEATEIYNS